MEPDNSSKMMAFVLPFCECLPEKNSAITKVCLENDCYV